MMTAREIAAILIAFDEGKTLFYTKPHFIDRVYKQEGVEKLLNSLSNGAHFEVAREPMTVWIPTFKNKHTFTLGSYLSEDACNIDWDDDNNYTGAVQFKEVIEP